jgi:isoamylase
MKVWPGQPYPLGATYDGTGTNFSLFSEIAERVQLCLYDGLGMQSCIDLPEATGYCWHGYLPQCGTGSSVRVSCTWPVGSAQRAVLQSCQAALRSLRQGDRRAVELVRGRIWSSTQESADLRSDIASAPFVPRSIIHDPVFEWSGKRRLQRPLHETVIYETHVKGFTALHPEIPPELRGTYLGMAHPAAIGHLQRLGITAVELMPVQEFVHEQDLHARGLLNYWGITRLVTLPLTTNTAQVETRPRCRCNSNRWSRRCIRRISR